METIDEKIESASKRIRGFDYWLAEIRKSRIPEYLKRGIKREIMALDYNSFQQSALAILRGEMKSEIPGDKNEIIIPDEIKFYRDQRILAYGLSKKDLEELFNILEESRRNLDIRIIQPYNQNREEVEFEVAYSDKKGDRKTARFFERYLRTDPILSEIIKMGGRK